MSIPFEDSRSSTDILIRLKTHRSDGVLLLAAGTIDYCVVLMERGGIKVRINLGSGEVILTSSPGLRLDDLSWHDVQIQRTDAELSMTIDKIHTTYLDIPGRFFELNIKYGVYVGSLGGFKEIFLGNLESYRGCMEEVTFNDHDILTMAAESPDQRNVYGVTWDCSEEFDASSYQAISLVGRGAFVALPSWNARGGGTLSFSVKTQSRDALLFYNAGTPSMNDFVAVEIVGSKVALSVNEGNGVVALQSDDSVNDGQWHQVEVRFGPSYVELTTDGHQKNIRQGLGENRFFDLAGYLYAGGIELNKQSRALQQGLQSVLTEGADSFLKGCLKNIKVNDEVVGIREAEVTQGVRVNCVWQYTCSQNPCVDGAECFQEGVDSFRCMCAETICIRSNFTSGYKLYTKSDMPIDMEILSLNPLEVKEGGSELVTPEHIRIIMDYQKYGLRESNILFHIVEPPKHGTLEIEIWRKSGENIFTLLDLNTDKIRYSHDGSEDHKDSVLIELEFRARNYRLPTFLEQRHQFVFHVHVIPVNDPPMLKVPQNKIFRLARYTKKTLTPDILKTEDEDNPPKDLVYTVLNLGAPDEGGFIESAKKPGEPIDSFTQEEVENRVINFVHRGPPESKLALSVSDGVETGQTAVIRVNTFDLVISLVNNTGLVIPYNSHYVIHPDNLTFGTNALEQNLEIRYDLTKLPQFGTLKKLRMNNKWHPVNHFTQRQINKGKIRYEHTTGRPAFDEFKYSISCLNITVPTLYDFRISFTTIDLVEVANRELVLENVVEGHITEADLKHKTSPVSTPADQITYTITAPTLFGNLVLFQPSENRMHRRLDTNSFFTQQDIDNKHLKYKIHRKSHTLVNDQFVFQVSSPDGFVLDGRVFRIKHVPSESNAVVTNEKLEVAEGDSVAITPKHLFIRTPGDAPLSYNISIPPANGFLRLMSPSLTQIETQSLTYFTNEDLVSGRVFYAHDDSETEHDSFHFTAVSKAGAENFQYSGVFHIGIIMKNDNPPIRTVDKVFNVVQGGERKLTGKDLMYVDADVDSKPADIQYTRRGIPNGALFHIDNQNTQVYQFTQEDLNRGRVFFRHIGADYARVVLWITDGQFYATGILEIRASKPFINVSRNSGLTVRRGESQFITSYNLTVDTNENASPSEISYKIVSKPKYGEILINGKEGNQFTQKDLDADNVEYENDNSLSFTDSFKFVAYFGDINIESVFQLRIFPDSYWQPLSVFCNKTLYVDEGQQITIDARVLNVAHANVNPANITYHVKVAPTFGYLQIENRQGDVDDSKKGTPPPESIKTFNQDMINEGKLVYVQTEYNVTEDCFVVDVTNGITSVTDLKLTMNIISKIILLRTGNLTVFEGKEVKLSPEEVGAANAYYTFWITEFLIVEQPHHGHLINNNVPGFKLAAFSPTQLNGGQIRYVHDGSETSRDWFTLVAKAEKLGKESAPSTVHVMVEPVNDEAPHLVNNTGLVLWEGSVATITNNHLSALDDDSTAEDVTFVISNSNNGYVAYKNDTMTPILSFTQEQINQGLVVYLHTGDSAGGFRFQVNDGTNYDSPKVFTVTASPLKIVVLVNEKLYIFPRMQQSITKDHLNVRTNDLENNRDIVFHVTQPPTLGRILLESPDGSLNPVTQFTQDQIDRSLLLYEQTHSLAGVSATDRVVFDIETAYAEIMRNVAFRIEISVGNIGSTNYDQLVVLKNLEVEEGGEIVVNQKYVNVSKLLEMWQKKSKNEVSDILKITVHELPRNGWLELEGENVTEPNKATFGYRQLRNKLFRYHHDDSETFDDDFTLNFFISGASGSSDIQFMNGTINVTVIPVNDQPFELHSIAPKLKVIQGQTVEISSNQLNTTDDDGILEEIVYEIIENPTNGLLVFKSNMTVSVHSFNQDDIEKGNVYFVHDGTRGHGTFHFKVSDGRHKPFYNIFNIHVVPLSLELVNATDIELVQGQAAVFLKNRNLGARTNGDPNEIYYNVTVPPIFGRIFMNDDVTYHFRQFDVDSEVVMYMQYNFTASEDRFVVSIVNPENIIADRVVNITVVPFVKQKSTNLLFGSVSPLTLDCLDASKLAEQTNSNPLYTVTKPPSYGSLALRKGGDRVIREAIESISEFTHEDIVKQSVVIVAPDMNSTDNVVIEDSFEYRLTAIQVQPANGKFEYAYRHFLPESTETVSLAHDTLGFSPTPFSFSFSTPTAVSTTESSSFFSPSIIGNDEVLIIVVVAVVLVVTIVVVASIKCRVSKNKQKKREKRASQIESATKFPGSLTAQTDLGVPDRLSSEDFPPPPPNTSPSSDLTGSVCASPKPRTIANKSRRMEVDSNITPPPPPLPYLTDGDWTEVSGSVPTCKVTPLGTENGAELKGEFCLQEPSEISESDDWQHYDGGVGAPGDMRFGVPVNPLLGKNQYWV